MRPTAHGSILSPWIALGGLLSALVIFAAGPPSFDALDGAEFTVASDGLSIAHPPSHPLFLMLLRIFPGRGFASGRLMLAILGGATAVLAAKAAAGPGAMRALSACALVFSPPILAQFDTVEVYGLALFLALAALLMRSSPAGPYLFGLSVFGGHPLCALLAPAHIGRHWRRWWPLALPAVGLMLYVPLRAASPSALDPHYTRPDTLRNLSAFFGMYSGRLGGISTGGFALLGPWTAAAAVPMCILAAAGRPRPGEIAALILSLGLLAFYAVPDPAGMAFPAVLSLWLPAARGAAGLSGSRSIAARIAAPACMAAVAALGLAGSVRSSDRIARTISCDMLRETDPGAVYCTTGHDTFHAAYLLSIEDLRPDVIPSDTYGNYFHLSLREPFPDSIGGRPVIATRAWESPSLLLSGLVFRPADAEEEAVRLDVEGLRAVSPDAFATDLAAEAFARLAMQTSGSERDSLSRLALSMAGTRTTRARLEAMLEIR